MYGLPSAITTPIVVVEDLLKERQFMAQLVREQLLKAQQRMEHYANKHHTDREFQVGDLVYLKLQPYKQTTVALRSSIKLAARYYGPFPVLE